jgi:hypothetical protein
MILLTTIEAHSHNGGKGKTAIIPVVEADPWVAVETLKQNWNMRVEWECGLLWHSGEDPDIIFETSLRRAIEERVVIAAPFWLVAARRGGETLPSHVKIVDPATRDAMDRLAESFETGSKGSFSLA